jgi:hypothetical protein
MRREWKGPNGKPVPHHVATHLQAVQDWDDAEAAALARANRGPTAAERFNHLRNAQAAAAAEGRTLPVPPAPEPAPARTTDLTLAERWGVWRDPRA